MIVILAILVGLVILGLSALLYGLLYVWRPETFESARSARFGIVGGSLVYAVSAVGGIVASTRIEPMSTIFGTVRPIALIDLFTLGAVLGLVTTIGSTVLVVWS